MKNFLWNMIASLRNGLLVKKSYIIHPRKKVSEMILDILWNEGFISGYKISKSNPNFLIIFLKYKNGKPAISSLKLISKPSLRVYYSLKQIWKFDFSQGLLLLSTSKGFMSINDCKRFKLGGEPFIIIK